MPSAKTEAAWPEKEIRMNFADRILMLLIATSMVFIVLRLDNIEKKLNALAIPPAAAQTQK